MKFEAGPASMCLIWSEFSAFEKFIDLEKISDSVSDSKTRMNKKKSTIATSFSSK